MIAETAGMWALLILATLFASVSKAGFGSGAAFLSSALLALVLPPIEALALMLPLLVVVDLATLRPYWGKWDASMAWQLVGWALPGIALGWVILAARPENVIRALIGLMCLLFVAWRGWQIVSRRVPLSANLPRWAVPVAGGMAGFASFVSHAGGPAVTVILLLRGFTKTRFQATTVLVFFAINIVKLAIYGAMGVFTRPVLLTGTVLIPVALVGAWLGVVAHRIIPERAFFALTYLLLSLTGVRLLWVAVAG
ncbi:MAG: hypothetical protein CSA72_00735 [Rhodobacterales bacterium]|nr:MAG: hypothetical protein CSA72_00735 [Rhodobacterales bacterium]